MVRFGFWKISNERERKLTKQSKSHFHSQLSKRTWIWLLVRPFWRDPFGETTFGQLLSVGRSVRARDTNPNKVSFNGWRGQK